MSTCRSFYAGLFPFLFDVPDERGKETEGSEATQRPTNDWPQIFVRPVDIRFNLFREFHENQRTLNSTTFSGHQFQGKLEERKLPYVFKFVFFLVSLPGFGLLGVPRPP